MSCPKKDNVSLMSNNEVRSMIFVLDLLFACFIQRYDLSLSGARKMMMLAFDDDPSHSRC
jgi:hypothetical protein